MKLAHIHRHLLWGWETGLDNARGGWVGRWGEAEGLNLRKRMINPTPTQGENGFDKARLWLTLHASYSDQKAGRVSAQQTREVQVWCSPLQIHFHLRSGSRGLRKLPEGKEGRAVVRPGIKEVGSEGVDGLLAAWNSKSCEWGHFQRSTVWRQNAKRNTYLRFWRCRFLSSHRRMHLVVDHLGKVVRCVENVYLSTY